MPSVFYAQSVMRGPFISWRGPSYTPLGVFIMCRKSHLHGCCILCFGLGLICGHCLESWFFCCLGGFALIILGLCVMRKRR